MKKGKMIIAGHTCLDITPSFGPDLKGTPGEILSPGKMILVGEADIHPGGSAPNTGQAAKFLGADVNLIGKTGDDRFGEILRSFLREQQLEDGMLTDPEGSTSYTVVMALPGADRFFLHNPGVNDSFSEADITDTALDEAVHFHFGYPPVLKKMYEDDGAGLTRMYRRAKERGCLTSLDLCAIDEQTPVASLDWIGILGRTLPFVDFFVPSIEEVLFIVDRERYHELRGLASGGDFSGVLDMEKDVAPVAERLLGMGCAFVMLKCGAAGFYYKSASRDRFAAMEKLSGRSFADFADQEGIERSYVPEKMVSATGAGDTTIAAFLTAMTKEYPFEMCLKLAAATGACCVSAPDSLSGLKPFDELQRRIEAGWKKRGE